MKRRIAAILIILITLSMPFSHLAAYATEPDTETIDVETVSEAPEHADADKEEASGSEEVGPSEGESQNSQEQTEKANPPAEDDADEYTDEPDEHTDDGDNTNILDDEQKKLEDAVTQQSSNTSVGQETIFAEPEEFHIEDDGIDNDELFAGYVMQVMYEGIDERIPEPEADLFMSRPLGSLAPIENALSTPEKKLYALLKAEITKVANGERDGTNFYFSPADIIGKTTFTASELGLSNLNDSSAVQKAIRNLFGNIQSVMTALRIDCPYELYWFDKTCGWGISRYDYYSRSGNSVTIHGQTYIWMYVAAAYSATGNKGDTQADTTKTGAATMARANASAIVANHAGEDDYTKLKSYRDEICAAVEYNYAALGSGVPYGDPWQLIYVFDNDDSTNVVCEGYAKAFQLLCDLSAFQSDKVDCISVSGNMAGGSGAGGHMWNVVTMDDGENYIADITNSDSGYKGNFRLFMRGAPEGTASGYTIEGVTYTYYDGSLPSYDNVIAMYPAAKRKLSENNFYSSVTNDPAYLYNIDVNPISILFDPVWEGDPYDTQTIAVRLWNRGTQNLTGRISVALDGADAQAFTLYASSLQYAYLFPNYESTFDISTKSGLPAKHYRSTIRISITDTDVSDIVIPVSFNVMQKVRVTFDTNGGKAADGIDLQKDVYYEGEYGTLPVVSRTGYRFDGWYTENEGGTPVTETTTVNNAESHTLYAHWVPIPVQVTFDANGGFVEGAPEISDFVDFDSAYGELPNAIRAGYILEGWFTDQAAGTQVLPDMILKNENPHTLYAHWSPKYRAAAPVANIGLPDGTVSEVDPGERIKLSSATNGSVIYYKTYKSLAAAQSDKASFSDIALKLFRKEVTVGDVEESEVLLCEDAFALTEEMADETTRSVVILTIALKEHFKNSDVVCYNYTLRDTAEDWGDLVETGDKDLFNDASTEAEDKNGDGKIDAQDVPDKLWVTGISDFEYDGTAKKQTGMRVYHHTTLLTAGKDYTVKYTKNKNAGTATVTITGKKNYKGTVKQTFTIRKINLSVKEADNLLNAPEITLTYNGKVQKAIPSVTVTVDGRTVKLKAGTDFTCIYPGTDKKSTDPENPYNPDAFKTASAIPYEIIVIGKGKNFEGTITVNEWITDAKQASKFTIVKIPNQTYDGTPKEPAVIVRYGKTTLTEGVDYEMITSDSYANNIEIGTATVTVTGIGNKDAGTGYIGTKTATFKITGGKTLSKSVSFTNVKTLPGYEANLKGFPYTGLPYEPAGPAKEDDSAQEPVDPGVITLTDKSTGDVLTRGTDYTVSYKNNVSTGTATIVFTGKGYYKGTVKKTFAIKGYSLSTDTQSAQPRIAVYWESDDETEWPADGSSNPIYAYVKGGVKPGPVVKYVYTVPDDPDKTVERLLVKGVDYTLSYKNNNGAGDKDSVKKGKSIAPTVTIKGKKVFSGTISRTFTIEQRAFDDVSNPLKVTATDILWKNKNNICKPKVTVTDANGIKLTAGKDYEKKIVYTYVYDTMVNVKNGKSTIKDVLRKGETDSEDGDAVLSTDIIPAGTVIRATITGKGNYTGDTITTTFRMVKADIGKATVKVSQQTFNGKKAEPDKDALTVKIGKTTLSKTDYEIVSYSNNERAGTAKITLRGTGNYGGTRTVTFRIGALSIKDALIY